jgi:hypothetical protein
MKYCRFYHKTDHTLTLERTILDLTMKYRHFQLPYWANLQFQIPAMFSQLHNPQPRHLFFRLKFFGLFRRLPKEKQDVPEPKSRPFISTRLKKRQSGKKMKKKKTG